MIHERKMLVQRPLCHVSRCSCGVYHVSTGSVTLRMERPQLEDLLRALEVVLVPEQDDDEASEDPPIH
jgi:hypothetical protein